MEIREVDGMREVNDEEAAVAQATAALRSRLGWSSDSEARTEVESRFAPVAKAMFRQQSPDRVDEEQSDKDLQDVDNGLRLDTQI